jgi:hypothetical protein
MESHKVIQRLEGLFSSDAVCWTLNAVYAQNAVKLESILFSFKQ